MDEQLNLAPCGYFLLNADWEIIDSNQKFKEITKSEKPSEYLPDLLTAPSRIYFQTYFLPTIVLHKQVREMYLNFRIDKRTIPALLNVNERNGLYECVIVRIKTRNEYEKQLMNAKKSAERIQKETDEANEKLLLILEDVEEKQMELKKLNEELQILAAHDELTGLPNRRVFHKDLTNAIRQANEKSNYTFSLVVLDIDHFKKVNDIYGHALGDKVLTELAKKMEQMIRPPHLVARIGGEEFAIIFYELNAEEATRQAEAVREFIAISEWDSIAVTISVGVTQHKVEDTSNSLFTRADDALYAAKRGGRNRVICQ